MDMITFKFEEEMYVDCLEIIVSFIDPDLLVPLYFVNKRWNNLLKGCERIYEQIFLYTASEGGYLELLKWANIKPDLFLTEAAARGNLECLKYLYGIGCPIGRMTMHAAVMNGSLDCIKFLQEVGEIIMDIDLVHASNYASIECLMYVDENRIGSKKSFGTQACHIAALAGNLDALKYLHETGREWDSSTCISAAEEGHLDCLKYAHQNGCECGASVYQTAEMYGMMIALNT